MGLNALLVGRLRPELGSSGLHGGTPVADVRSPDAVQDAVARLGEPAGALIVICGPDDVAEVRHQLALLSIALPHIVTVLEQLPGPPLAVAAAAGLVHDPGHTRDVACQLAALDLLRESLWSAIWLPSVAGLRTPQPSLGQHLRAWFTHAGFLALSGSYERVCTLAGQTLPDLADMPRGGLLVSADDGAPGWLTASLAAAAEPVDQIELGSWRHPRDAFGVDRCAEFVVVPEPLYDVDALVMDRVSDCPGCGRRHPREACPFCRMGVRAADPSPVASGARA